MLSQLDLATEETPLAESVRRCRALVSPYTGLVRSAEQTLASPDDSRLVHVDCTTGDCTALTGDAGVVTGGGSGRSLDEALVAAVGEVAERYSGAWSAGCETVLATAAELGAEAVAPERFTLFSERQHNAPGFPFRRFTAATRVSWVRGISLPAGEPAWLPAQLVYMPWPLRPGEEPIGHATSNGLAAHATFAEATLSGLLEVLERDAFMITWGARLEWPRLVWSSNSPLSAFSALYFEPTGLKLAALDMSAIWGVPCVLGVARSRVAGDAPIGVGAGAAATIERAAEKALDEALRVRSWARELRLRDPRGERLPRPDAIVQFEEHVAFYSRNENAERAVFLAASGERRRRDAVPPLEGATVGERIATICDRLDRERAGAFCVDVTAPDVRAAGVTVARVVVPELCPLDAAHATRHLGGTRRLDVPAALGLTGQPLREDELNPDPHPFP